MPHFYFDTDDGDTADRDDEGFDLADVRAARVKALEALPDMARDKIPNGDHRRLSVGIRDETGATVYSVQLTLSGGWEIASSAAPS